jgi:hypothetical protein
MSIPQLLVNETKGYFDPADVEADSAALINIEGDLHIAGSSTSKQSDSRLQPSSADGSSRLQSTLVSFLRPNSEIFVVHELDSELMLEIA